MGRFVRLASSLTLAIFLAHPVNADADAAQPGPTAPRPGAPKTAAKPPANDPRQGPRLEYTRGPAECLSEQSFRDEVAVILDSIDHFDVTSRDAASVKFEKIPGGYRGTLVYTNAAGEQNAPTIKTYYNCEILGRWLAGSASGLMPGAAKEAPSAVPSAAPSDAAPAAPSAAPSLVPSAPPSSASSAWPAAMPSAVPSSVVSAHPDASAPESAPVRAARWCIPEANSRSVLRTSVCAAGVIGFASAALAIGAEIDRGQMHSYLGDSGCNPALPADARRCAVLHDRVVQRDVAMSFTLGATIVAGIAGAALGLRLLLDRNHPSPTIAPSISAQGGGINVSGAW